MIIVTSFIIALASISLLLFWHFNHYRCVERYYFDNYKTVFVIIEICLLIMIFSLVFNVKHILFGFAGKWIKKLKKRL